MVIPCLVLGGGRYLDLSGEVIPARRTYSDDEVELYRSITPDWDPELEAAPGDPTVLTDDNRPYWEDVARRGGYALDDLLVRQL